MHILVLQILLTVLYNAVVSWVYNYICRVVTLFSVVASYYNFPRVFFCVFHRELKITRKLIENCVIITRIYVRRAKLYVRRVWIDVNVKMANVRDSDTSLWLHNKLGTSNDSWINGSICSQLNKEVLRNIKDCFPDLQTQVKLKLLLSFLHIPRRLVEEVKKISLVSWNKKYTSLYTHTQNTSTHTHMHVQAHTCWCVGEYIRFVCCCGPSKCSGNVSNMREITNWRVLKFT